MYFFIHTHTHRAEQSCHTRSVITMQSHVYSAFIAYFRGRRLWVFALNMHLDLANRCFWTRQVVSLSTCCSASSSSSASFRCNLLGLLLSVWAHLFQRLLRDPVCLVCEWMWECMWRSVCAGLCVGECACNCVWKCACKCVCGSVCSFKVLSRGCECHWC